MSVCWCLNMIAHPKCDGLNLYSCLAIGYNTVCMYVCECDHKCERVCVIMMVYVSV